MQTQMILQRHQSETSAPLHSADLSSPLTQTPTLHFQLGTVVHVCSASTQEAEAERRQV